MNIKLENIICNTVLTRYQLFKETGIWIFNKLWTHPPSSKKIKKKKNLMFPFVQIFFWPIKFGKNTSKHCLYNLVHVLVHTEKKTRKDSLSLTCNERFVSTDTLSLHGQASDVFYEMSEPQRICLHLVLLTILRKKNIIPIAGSLSHTSYKSIHSLTPKNFCTPLSL